MKVRYLALPLIFFAALLVWFGLREPEEPVAEEATAGDVAIERTRASERQEEGPEQERRRREAIAAAAQKWYEELLEKYPEMKPEYRDVPDEENGYLQFLLLAERAGEPRLPEELRLMATGAEPWDGAAFQRWLHQNADYVMEILRIAELPDQSSKGIDFERVFREGARNGGAIGAVLVGAGRVALEKGDHPEALRHMKAALSLGEHLTGVEVPSMLGRVVAAGYEAAVHETFRAAVLPAIAGDPALLREWGAALEPRESGAETYARVMMGEWNVVLRQFVLPTLLGDSSIIGPEVHALEIDELAAAFMTIQKGAAEGVLREGPGRFDVVGGTPAIPSGNFQPATLQALEGAVFSTGGMAAALGIAETRRAMSQAAIAILLGEEPPVDPVTGEAFIWNPETRELIAPGSEVIDPLVVP